MNIYKFRYLTFLMEKIVIVYEALGATISLCLFQRDKYFSLFEQALERNELRHQR